MAYYREEIINKCILVGNDSTALKNYICYSVSKNVRGDMLIIYLEKRGQKGSNKESRFLT